MKVTQKIFYVFVFMALISFVGALAGAEETARININTADVEALSTLGGIGEKKAEAIIEYRKENGPFSKIEDLKNVKGIGDKVFEKIKDQITVE